MPLIKIMPPEVIKTALSPKSTEIPERIVKKATQEINTDTLSLSKKTNLLQKIKTSFAKLFKV